MKKVKYIALILILMLGLIGGAYAYWTNQVVVSGTVATGGLDVRITRWHPSSGLETGYTFGSQWIDGWNNNNDGKTASATIVNLHPGEESIYQNMQLQIKNFGTVPVKLESVDVEKTDGDDILWNNFYGSATIRLYDDKNTQIGVYGPTPAKPFSELGTEIMSLMDSHAVQLNPGYVVRFGNDEETNSIRFWLKPGAGNDTQNMIISFDITFNWVQWNKP